MRRAVTCPRGCGSTNFHVTRHGAITQDFIIDDETGEIVEGGSIAEGGGPSIVNCECGHSWISSRDSVSGLARFMEER